MEMLRRSFIGAIACSSLVACSPLRLGKNAKGENMYGLIGKMTAIAGERERLAEILLEGLRDMPGNLSYIVAADAEDANLLWITEVWTDRDSHTASLSLPSVQQAIQKGRPLIAGMERIAETAPTGGNGL